MPFPTTHEQRLIQMLLRAEAAERRVAELEATVRRLDLELLLKPEEFWESADDEALALVESAQAELRGERPLFVECIGQPTPA